MADIIPTLGRIVLYCLPQYQVEEINRRRAHATAMIDYHRWRKSGAMVHVGNEVKVGQIVPAMVVAVLGDGPDCAVNLKLFLDGSDDFWVTSTSVEKSPGEDEVVVHTPGKYHWMAYQKKVANGEIAPTRHAEPKAV